jgi:hypothetical protein
VKSQNLMEEQKAETFYVAFQVNVGNFITSEKVVNSVKKLCNEYNFYFDYSLQGSKVNVKITGIASILNEDTKDFYIKKLQEKILG